jgi:hypothetical protein
MAGCYRVTIVAMAVFDPLADTLAAALRTLVLLGVLSAAAGLPAAIVAWKRKRGAPGWLGYLAGPEIAVHALNLALFAFLTIWIVVDAARGRAPLPATGQFLLFAASFLGPNLAGIVAWRYVRGRRCEEPPLHVVPAAGP